MRLDTRAHVSAAREIVAAEGEAFARGIIGDAERDIDLRRALARVLETLPPEPERRAKLLREWRREAGRRSGP